MPAKVDIYGGKDRRELPLYTVADAARVLVSTYPCYDLDEFTTPDLTYQIDVTNAIGSRIVSRREKKL